MSRILTIHHVKHVFSISWQCLRFTHLGVPLRVGSYRIWGHLEWDRRWPGHWYQERSLVSPIERKIYTIIFQRERRDWERIHRPDDLLHGRAVNKWILWLQGAVATSSFPGRSPRLARRWSDCARGQFVEEEAYEHGSIRIWRRYMKVGGGKYWTGDKPCFVCECPCQHWIYCLKVYGVH
jgi:hypothetical protein